MTAFVTRECARCGEAFSVETRHTVKPGRGLYCSRACANRAVAPTRRVASGVAHVAWRGDDATPEAQRRRAQRRYELGDCERCGERATDRHHVDGDTGNNTPENIARLCRRCHMLIDGRLDALRTAGVPPQQPPKPCRICARLAKPLRKGRCGACNEYLRRNGVDRPALQETA